MISVRNLRKQYDTLNAVDDISFDIKAHEIVGLLGPNGAGKTTTMRILTGFLPATSGEVTVNSHDAVTDSFQLKNSIGYLPENCPLYQDMKVEEFLLFMAASRGIAKSKRAHRVNEIAEMTGISDRLKQDIGTLSKGYRQRVGLAGALIHDPPVLILDEPTSGLDPNQILEIRALIRHMGKNKTIILSTHILSEAEATCDRVLIIHKGKIVASGTSEELRRQHVEQAFIRVKIEGNCTGLISTLEKIPGLVRVLQLESPEKHFHVFEVETASQIDLRKDIASAILKEGFSLVEIVREEKSLESIFAELTKL